MSMTHETDESLDSEEIERSEQLARSVRGDEFSGDELRRDNFDGEEFDDDLPSGGLLSFYDRLRERILRFAESKGGKLGPKATEALLLVPDVFILLVRLMLDKDVPKSTRALIGSALAYFVLPVDLLPEAMLGPVGYMDDLVLALTVMAQAFGPDLEPYTARYWSGSQPLRRVIGDILEASKGLLSADVYERLRKVLAKQGIDLDRATQEAARNAGTGTEEGPSERRASYFDDEAEGVDEGPEGAPA